MSTLPLFNNAEGGTDDVVVSEANSGGASGDAFDIVYIDTQMTLRFDDDGGSSDGSMAYRIHQVITPTDVFGVAEMIWTLDESYSVLTISAQVKAEAASDPIVIMEIDEGGTSDGAQVIINTDGTLSLGNNHLGGAVAATSTTEISPTDFTRLDLAFVANTSMTLSIYQTDPHGTTPDEVISSGDVGVLGDGLASQIDFGLINWYNGFSDSTSPIWMDELAAYVSDLPTTSTYAPVSRRITTKALPYQVHAAMLGSPIIGLEGWEE